MASLHRLFVLLVVLCLAAVPRTGMAGEWRTGGAAGDPGVLPLAVLVEALPRDAIRKAAPDTPQTPDLPALEAAALGATSPAFRILRAHPVAHPFATREPARARHPRDPPLARV